jgi:hypothetical protein
MAQVGRRRITDELAVLQTSRESGHLDPISAAIYLEDAIGVTFAEEVLESGELGTPEGIQAVLDRYARAV